MNTWSVNETEPRKKAIRKFCEYLDDINHSDERELCKRNSTDARKLFARLGEFYLEENHNAPPGFDPIPTRTVFHVYDDTPWKIRDEDRVTIVLPNQGQLKPEPEFAPMDHWRCTYPPYDPLMIPPG